MARLQDLSVQRKLTVIIMMTTVLALLLASAAFYVFRARGPSSASSTR